MLVAIFSDVHDEVDNLLTALSLAEAAGCKHLLLAGDLTTLTTLRTLREEWSGGIDLVFGNNEWDHSSHLKLSEQLHDLTHHGDIADITLYGRRIYMSHYPQNVPSALRAKIYDLIIYGHTHKAQSETIGSTLILNPGEIAGVRSAPTIAIYDTSTGEHYFLPV